MIEATKTGLETYLLGSANTLNTSFKTAIGSRLYFVECPTFEGYPYAVINDVAPNVTRDSVNKFETERFQVAIHDNSGGSSTVGQIQGYLWNLLDDAEKKGLSITGFAVIECTREAPSGYQSKTDKVWHSITQYRIELQH